MSWIPISKTYVFVRLGDKTIKPLGVLAKSDEAFQFAYAKSWLSDPAAFAVDPIHLPLGDETRTARRMWGCFEDATPDNWGRRVMLATHKQKPQNDIEWLLATRGAGAGCLLFSASRTALPTLQRVPDFSELEQLLVMADEIDRGEIPEHLDESMVRLLAYGSSMGGARPKITVSHEGHEWIAKLTRRDDVFDQPRAEYASMQMAKAAGIDVPPVQLKVISGRPVLLVQRFDRSPGMQHHYLSANSLIAPDRVRVGDVNSPVSYLKMCEVIMKVSGSAQQDMRDLFRRMVFNISIANTDDHLKNHGFLKMENGQYRLSPAFDLLPHPGQTAEMALVVGKNGRDATFENALSACGRFGLSAAEGRAIIEEVCEVTSQSAKFFIEAGMKPLDVGILSAACTCSLAPPTATMKPVQGPTLG